MSVEKGLDELRVAVKFQSNTGIAGSPRNSFGADVPVGFREVERWTGEGPTGHRTTPNSECPESHAGAARRRETSRVAERETAQTDR